MKEVLTFFVENWYLVVLGVCAFILMISKIVEFIGYPTAKKKEVLKNSLLSYVTKAEMELGGGTGAIKLSRVYEYFCEKFPYAVKWISYEEFSALVDEILPTMRKVLEESGVVTEKK